MADDDERIPPPRARAPREPRRDGERKPFPKRDGERKPFPKRDGERRPSGVRESRGTRPPQDDRVRAPEIPDTITARDLDARARNELKTLTKDNADGVARHLAMAARLIDVDPQLALEHAQAASRRAGRIPVVRETVALTAYRLGDYTLALRELRTYRRLSGRDDQIAVLVDSERGLGRPDRALEEGRAVDRQTLPTSVRVELAIAMSGARLDQGDAQRALTELDIPELDPDRAFEWSPDLFAARAVVLEELGRDTEAATWRRRAEIAEEALDALDPQYDVIEVDDLDPDEPTVASIPASAGVTSDVPSDGDEAAGVTTP